MFAADMTWQEYEKEVPRKVVLLPVGSLEQHGPHLPLDVDVIIPTNFARMIGEEIGCVVLPTINYGYKSHPTSGGGQLFPGTTSLNGNTLINLVLDILQETYRHGGRQFGIINGHYENEAFIIEAVDLFLKEASRCQGSHYLVVGPGI
jgi:creatinine amidohydrolase